MLLRDKLTGNPKIAAVDPLPAPSGGVSGDKRWPPLAGNRNLIIFWRKIRHVFFAIRVIRGNPAAGRG